MNSSLTSVKDLSVEEKASFTSGSDAWHLQGIEDKGVTGYMITDGPHGLRKSAGNTEEIDLDHTVPATCFPPAVGMSSSWNPELIHEVGEAMAEECIQEKVGVILGPGVNIKRNPLGGRCFEYWSEDPYLAGHEAVGIVEGVQSKGVGTSLKHFAVNNQETDRLRISANVSQRALREIYFPAFEHIVKIAQPWTIMCSYNQINGVHSSQNRWLLTKVLRDEWGYQGIVMSDWGAVHNRVEALNAGLNLEMPPSYTDDQIVFAVKDGTLDSAQLDRMAQGMLDLVNKTKDAMSIENYRCDIQQHHAIARKAAVESVVLLKNEANILPLSTEVPVAVIGEFARTPRYQGGGSSHITPTQLSSFLDVVGQNHAVNFAPGYTLDNTAQTQKLTDEATQLASKAETVLLFLGLPESAESEGFDRTTLDLPAKQLELLDAISKVNSQVIVVLSNGSVVSIAPWQHKVRAIVEGWLLGQAGAEALSDIIFGEANPSGKLAQTIPMDLNDDPTMMNWPGEEGHVDYGEGIFVGYRYYDSFNKQVAYPFGYGLSYSAFHLSEATLEKTGPNTARITVKVSNTSTREGAETVQCYVAPETSEVARPKHELKGFAKVVLKPGETKTVHIDLDERAFAYWSERFNDWHIEEGKAVVEIGTSSRDIDARLSVNLEGDGKRLLLDEWSNMAQWQADPIGSQVLEDMNKAAQEGRVPALPSHNTAVEMFLNTMPINSLTALMGKDGGEIADYLLSNYAKAIESTQRQ